MSSYKTPSKGLLPVINQHNKDNSTIVIGLSYSQRYQHMTKLANYNEMNESQIWKEYEKLRLCLKQLNNEVLYHMEKKAYANISKQKDKPNKDVQGTLMLLEDEKRSNEIRNSTYKRQINVIDERIKYLSKRGNLSDQMSLQKLQLQAKIKYFIKQLKDLKRTAKLSGKDLVSSVSLMDILVNEEQKLAASQNKKIRYEEILKKINQKKLKFTQRINESQKAIEVRVQQFNKQDNYIAQQIYFDRFEQLRKQKQSIMKYQTVYKRNYLMKLKQLENLMNSLGKHDKIIQQTEINILTMREQIASISQIIGETRKKKSISVMQIGESTTRISTKQNTIRIQSSMDVKHGRQKQKGLKNDKNTTVQEETNQNTQKSSRTLFKPIQEKDDTINFEKIQLVSKNKGEIDA